MRCKRRDGACAQTYVCVCKSGNACAGEMDALRVMLGEATDAEMRSELMRTLLQPSAADALASLATDLPCLQVGTCSARYIGL